MSILDATFARGPVSAGGPAADPWLVALLEVEGALARAAARVGLVAGTAADEVSRVCADPGGLDLAAVQVRAADAGNPVPPLVRALQDAVGPHAARAVHVGATSQDVMDTAAVLLARRGLQLIEADLATAAEACARLATEHRDDVLMGRTLLQQALPITVGLKAATWLAGLDGVRARLTAVSGSLPVQYGGAVGTLAASSGSGVDLRRELAAELGLAVTDVPWFTVRLPVADVAGVLGAAAGVVATIAVDVVLLAQSEVAEATEVSASRGGSSAMPHKNNPVAAVSARACARRAPGLVATLYAAMEQEHERGAGTWHVEWPTLTELLGTVGSAASWLTECLADLQLDTTRMAAAVAAAGDPQLARALAEALTPSLGAGAAHDAASAAVRTAASEGRALVDVVLERADVDGAALVADSTPDVGEAGAQVDAALAAHVIATQGGRP
ncbi:3-carboxy-cis,cis-muconate cycloisomerase [Modestobacter italicus]|uniref:3-carboxy-cis,cis-muconate cycloisomerase n=1 Tax=Modestobacter italicus (strain DSM 44449 / CECT 9708 / BC 501) TaxID=2732864 RepID=I4F4C2_MODI5|nr:lyase family protein [Modestobacter marinus]CCH90485.1 3-carboxy-cis,cis-muconate cycloisomerase [Modestobacter marinus]